MNKHIYVDCGMGDYEVFPYNINDLKVYEKPAGYEGSWMFQKSCDVIELIGRDYAYVYNAININKCTNYYLKITCNNIEVFYGVFNFYTCDIDKDNCLISIKTSLYNTDAELFELRWEQEYSLNDITSIIVNGIPGATYNYTHCKLVNEVFDMLAGHCGLTYSSQFLQNNICPIVIHAGDLNSPYNTIDTSTNNPYKRLVLTKSLSSTNQIISMSLKTLLTQICRSFFNLYWHIDWNTLTLHVEHALYYLNGKSYTIPNIVGLDLTTINNGIDLKETNKYNIISDQLNWKETYTPSVINFDTDMNTVFGWNLFYSCNPLSKRDNKKEIRQEFETHFVAVEYNGTDAILLLATQQIYTVNSILFNGLVQNYVFESRYGYFMYLWNCQLPEVTYDLSIATITANSIINIFEQDEISFPMCCDPIDMYKLVKTNLGIGYIDNYSLNISTGEVVIKPKFNNL